MLLAVLNGPFILDFVSVSFTINFFAIFNPLVLSGSVW